MKVYITLMTDFGPDEKGEDKILSVFRNYEKARNFCIDKANSQTVNTELYCELDYERDGEYFAIGVYRPADAYDDSPIVEKRFFVVEREVN